MEKISLNKKGERDSAAAASGANDNRSKIQRKIGGVQLHSVCMLGVVKIAFLYSCHHCFLATLFKAHHENAGEKARMQRLSEFSGSTRSFCLVMFLVKLHDQFFFVLVAQSPQGLQSSFIVTKIGVDIRNKQGSSKESDAKQDNR
eukprot:764737-Hanusia_phi.AAC.5